MIWKETVKTYVEALPSTYLERWGKNHEDFRQDNWCPEKGSIWKPLESKHGSLQLEAACSLICCIASCFPFYTID
jgi:hypothetical protein